MSKTRNALYPVDNLSNLWTFNTTTGTAAEIGPLGLPGGDSVGSLLRNSSALLVAHFAAPSPLVW